MDLEIFKFMYSFYEENKVIVLTSITASIIRTGLDSIIIPRAMANVFNSLNNNGNNNSYIEFRNALIMLIFIWIIMKLIFVVSNYCRKMIEFILSRKIYRNYFS